MADEESTATEQATESREGTEQATSTADRSGVLADAEIGELIYEDANVAVRQTDQAFNWYRRG